MKYLKANILNVIDDYDVVVHGCNCWNRMGSGIAKVLARKYPEIVDADNRTARGDRGKLGTYTVAITPNQTHIINAYTQYYYGRPEAHHLDYEALRKVFKEIKQDYGFAKSGVKNRFLLPKIGAGLAGGDWNIIEKIIQEELYDEDITIVYL